MATENSSIADLLRQSFVLNAVSDSPRLDMEVLLCHVLGKPRSYLFTWPEKQLEHSQYQYFNALVQRRAQGEPVAYLLGEKEFWSLSLAVNSTTLIPRPDTELLVETALKAIDKPCARVLDLGTGTGAIALALASEHPAWQITGVDRVLAAVQLAEQNRQRLKLNNVSVLQSDWFENVGRQRFDLIVTNPPYIDPEDCHLNKGDVRFEPRSALVSAKKGLADIEIIISGAKNHLAEGALLLIEHGSQQAQAVRGSLLNEGYKQVATQRDIAGHERLTQGIFTLT